MQLSNFHNSQIANIDNEEKQDQHRHRFGALSDLISDPTVEEIWINNPARIFFARDGKTELAKIVMTSVDVRNLVERLLNWSGRRLDTSSPLVDARLPDGSRLHAAIPEITAKHWSVNIRKHLINNSQLSDLVAKETINEQLATLIQDSILAQANVLVSGATQAGKTTFLNALINAIPARERLITIEEVFELNPNLADHVALQTRPANLEGNGEISMRRLVKESLRMRPNRLVIGEVREAEALDLLIALNSGLPGMGTIHANSAKSAIAKLQTLPLLAGENIAHTFINRTIAATIDLVIHLVQLPSGARKLKEIFFITGRIESDQIEMAKLVQLNSLNNSWNVDDANWKLFLSKIQAS